MLMGRKPLYISAFRPINIEGRGIGAWLGGGEEGDGGGEEVFGDGVGDVGDRGVFDDAGAQGLRGVGRGEGEGGAGAQAR
jgi:hypothetical protein